MTVRTAIRLAAPAALALIVAVSGMPDALAANHPSAPRSVGAKPGNTTVRITWVPPLKDGGAHIDNYGVQRSAAAGGPWHTVAKPAATTFAWQDTGRTNGTRYYYRMRAHNAAGWGPASTVVSAVPRTVPSAPRSPAVSSGDAFATVSWVTPASSGGALIDAYQLQLSTDGSSWSTLSAGTQTQLTAGGLANGTQYHFRVRAHNAAGWGPVSSEVLTIPGFPLPPTQLEAHSTSDGVGISWTPSATASPNITQQDVEMSTDGVNWSNHGTYGALANHDKWPLTLGTTYYFRVRAENPAGISEWTSTVSAVSGLLPCAVQNASAQYFGTPWNFTTVSWLAASGTCGTRATNYLVERIVTEGTYTQVADLAAAQTSYTDSAVARFNTYYYRITPYNEVGYGPPVVVVKVIN